MSKDVIKQAAEGREAGILRALGIPGLESGEPTKCPIPGHNHSKGKIRWDRARRRWICTKGSGDIITLVQLMLGVTFQEALRWIAEQIGQPDLAKKRRSRIGALLNPHELAVWTEAPRLYLGARSGVDPGKVILPSTPCIGHRSSSYYIKSKVEIGSFPMLVFGMTDRDGRMHAHRIYLSADAKNKATVLDPDGEPLPARKLMPAPGGSSTAGMAVLFGATTASRWVIGEGIETCHALAVAMRPEVEAGELTVAACISAVGVEAFKPWPGTQSIVIGADRDE